MANLNFKRDTKIFELKHSEINALVATTQRSIEERDSEKLADLHLQLTNFYISKAAEQGFNKIKNYCPSNARARQIYINALEEKEYKVEYHKKFNYAYISW